MRLPRFRRLRRALSYANVMATLAFFFALTGGTMAVTKYLVATDTIPATSDLAGSTYGNPVIAAGKMTSGKIADGAITTSKFDGSAKAPDADKLDGKDSTGYATVVARGARVVVAGAHMGPGTCTIAQDVAPGADPSTDYAIVQPATNDERIFLATPELTTQGGVSVINIRICNFSEFDLPIGGTYRWVVLR